MKKRTLYFNKIELFLWIISLFLIIMSFLLFNNNSFISLIASIIGVTSLIFNAKGNPIGQFLMIILIILWILASIKDNSYLCVVVCFIVFFINDLYGFFNWKLMNKNQNRKTNRVSY